MSCHITGVGKASLETNAPAVAQASSNPIAAGFQSLTEQATKMRDKYRNNPYFSVRGFTVKMGVPPSVDLNFEFK